jgi:hypothetical protein
MQLFLRINKSMLLRKIALVLAMVIAAGVHTPALAAKPAQAKKFPVYYALKFSQPVSGFEQCGLTALPIIYPGSLFKGSKLGDRPDYAQLRKVGAPTVLSATANTADKLAVLDVEGSWDLQPGDSAVVMAGKALNYHDLLHFLKLELQSLNAAARLGYFRVAPPAFYQSPGKDGQKTPYELATAALKKVGNESDALFPQLYGYTTPENFQAYANGTLRVARANWPGKPVYPFLWMQRRVDPAQTGGQLRHEFLPKGAFGLQLQAVKDAGAEGVVIWGTVGDGQARADWNRNADWWLETKAFLKKQGVDLKACKL